MKSNLTVGGESVMHPICFCPKHNEDCKVNRVSLRNADEVNNSRYSVNSMCHDARVSLSYSRLLIPGRKLQPAMSSSTHWSIEMFLFCLISELKLVSSMLQFCNR